MTSIIYAHLQPSSNRLVGLLIEQAASHYLCDLFILSNLYLRSKNSPVWFSRADNFCTTNVCDFVLFAKLIVRKHF